MALCCGATSKMVLFMAVADSRVRENERGIVHDIEICNMYVEEGA